MSIMLMSQVWEKSRHRGEKLLLLLAIADAANEANQCMAWPSIAFLAKKIRADRRYTKRLIKELCEEENPELMIVKVGGGRLANVYRIVERNLGLIEETRGGLQTPSEGVYRPPQQGSTDPPNHNVTNNLTINSAGPELNPNDPETLLKEAKNKADAYKDRIRKAVETGIENQKSLGEIGEISRIYPEDVVKVLTRFAELWKLHPPGKANKGAFADWISGGRDLNVAVGELGLIVIDKVYEEYKREQRDHRGVPPYSVGRPQSIFKACMAMAGRLRQTQMDSLTPGAGGENWDFSKVSDEWREIIDGTSQEAKFNSY